MTVAIIDYGSGNLRSAAKAFERMAAETGGTEEILVTGDPDTVHRSDRIVLPGVGAFGDCRRGLYAIDGMVEALNDRVIGDGQPFFGICVGMQLMATVGLEHGRHDGLGWIGGTVRALTPRDPALKIPHMGWNELTFTEPRHPVTAGLDDGAHAYFVHSFHMVPDDPASILATVSYGMTVTAMIGRDNMIGAQFHPEKSQETGLRLIASFLTWTP